MAKYEHLPIFRKAMEMSVYLDSVVRNFSRYNKYTIGTDMRNLSREIFLLIIRANSAYDKAPALRELVERCEMLKTMLFFAKEVQAFNNFKSFQHAAGMAESLCRQSQGWLNKQKKRSQNHQPSKNVDR